jgi:hypothetical protein
MTTPTLAKPALATAILPATGIIGIAGTSFAIKVMRHRFRTFSPSAETTGDGDTVGAAVWENNGILYVRGVFVGAMIAGAYNGGSAVPLGFASLINSSLNPMASIAIQLDNQREINQRMLIESVEPDARRNGQFVGLRLTYRTTITVPAEDNQ